MKATLVRVSVLGALLLTGAPFASSSQAMTCGDLSWACSTACNLTETGRKVCSRLN